MVKEWSNSLRHSLTTCFILNLLTLIDITVFEAVIYSWQEDSDDIDDSNDVESNSFNFGKFIARDIVATMVGCLEYCSKYST